MSATLLDELAGLAPSAELRDRRLERIAQAFVEPLARALEPYMSQYNEPLVEPVIGRTGWHELLAPPSPASGASFALTVSGDEIVKPISIVCRLATSALAGQRSLTVEYQDNGGATYDLFGCETTLAASQTQRFVFHEQAGTPSWPIADAAVAPLAPQFLYPTSTLAIIIGGVQPGDQLDSIRISTEKFQT